MSEKTKLKFIEKLNLAYPRQFEIKKSGFPDFEHIIFPNKKNIRFGGVKIVGDINESRDEEDYFIEDENGVYDDAETCGFWLHINSYCFVLSMTEVFEMLNEIFSDKIVYYRSVLKKNRGYYRIEDLEKKLNEGKLRKKDKYEFWSGTYPLPNKEN